VKDNKSNMLWKSRKIKWQFFGLEENRKKANGEKIKYAITIGLISQRERHIIAP
jgi:hypothetical protein